MIDGIWWLVILLVVIAVLWFVAHLRGTKSNHKDENQKLSAAKSPPNDSLQKTAVLLKHHFPDYRTSRRATHLLIVKGGKKIAMITIDNSIAIGQRRLGDVPIINYHRVPSRAQLNTDLQNIY
ncbi:MAG: hypothetical protein N2B60_08985 [Psychrobacter sp.]